MSSRTIPPGLEDRVSGTTFTWCARGQHRTHDRLQLGGRPGGSTKNPRKDAKGSPPVDARTWTATKFSWDCINKRQVAQGIRIRCSRGKCGSAYRPMKSTPTSTPNSSTLPTSFRSSFDAGHGCRFTTWLAAGEPFSDVPVSSIPDRILGLKLAVNSSRGPTKTEPRDGELFESTTPAERPRLPPRRQHHRRHILQALRDTIGGPITRRHLLLRLRPAA